MFHEKPPANQAAPKIACERCGEPRAESQVWTHWLCYPCINAWHREATAATAEATEAFIKAGAA